MSWTRNPIVIGSMIVGIVLLVIFVVIPRLDGDDGEFDWPSIPGLTEDKVFVKFTVFLDASEAQVNIVDGTVRVKKFTKPLSIGPLWQTQHMLGYEGEIVVETIKDGSVIDSDTRNVDVCFVPHPTDVTFEFGWLELGKPGSGSYEIRATLYGSEIMGLPLQPGTVASTDSITKTI